MNYTPYQINSYKGYLKNVLFQNYFNQSISYTIYFPEYINLSLL